MKTLLPTLLGVLLTSPAFAGDDTQAIEYLLTAVGSSQCTFIRNGKEYSSEEAEAHLRMKYRRGKKWATDAEAFIERIASKSSMSRKPYRIRCGAAEAQLTSEWLAQRLAEFLPDGDAGKPDK